jgi:outer membrane protein assembly factor BamB
MKYFLVAAMALLLAACSSTETDTSAPASLVDIDNELKLKKVWSEGVGVGTGKRYTVQGLSMLASQVFSADAEGRITALDIESGKELWEVKLNLPVAGGTGAASGLVFVGTLNGEVLALDSASGEVRWQAQVGGEVLAAPQGNGTSVVVQTLSGRVFGLSAEDGSQVWRYDNPTPTLTLRGTASPVVDGTTVYLGFASGKIVALNADDGTLLWEQRVAVAQGRSELERVIDIDGSPLVVGNTVFSGSYQGRLVAINRITGQGVWATKESSYTSLAGGMGKIFMTTPEGIVKAYNADNGQLVWENDQLLNRQLNAPQTFSTYVAVADFAGYVHVLNQTDGTIVARRKVDGDGVRSPMLGNAGVLYVHGNGGDLEALSVR